MKRLILGITVLFASCNGDRIIDTSCDTAHDPFSDITYLNSGFYSTNNDASMNAGPQIFLYKTSNDGRYLDDIFNLNMNGQGYLAITDDGHDLYLQSRDFNSIIKCSPVGEVYYHAWDITNSQMQGCGICYLPDADSLCVLARDYRRLNHYSLLFADKNNPHFWKIKASSDINLFSSDQGAYAIKMRDHDLFILGRDTTDTDVLIKSNLSLDVIDLKSPDADSIAGFCFRDSTLYFSRFNKTIVKSDL
jgi:hypothetical protein